METGKIKNIAIIAAVLLSVLVAGFMMYNKPRLVPAFTLTTITGEKVSAESLRGKVYLVNFWATSCSGCVKEMPALVETYNKFSSKGFDTVAIAMSYDPPNYVLAFTEKQRLPFKVTLDTMGEASKAFGNVRLTPTSFVIDKEGHIVFQVIGEPDFKELQTLIAKKLEV